MSKVWSKHPVRTELSGESPYCVKADILHYDIIVSEFEIQSHFYVHFRANIITMKSR